MISIMIAAAMAASGAEATALDANADPVECRKSKIPVVGTRFKPAPVCKKKSEWAMERRQTARELQQINERGNNPGLAEGR